MGQTASRIYTIKNLGSAVLNLTGTPVVSISPAGQFSVVSQPPATVGQLSSVTFTVQFDPSSIGTHTATVSIANNDADENPYTFAISGVGANIGAPVTTSYTGPAVAIPDGNAVGVAIPFTVSGITGNIADVNLRFDGISCSASAGDPNVGLDHTWIGDLEIRLTSPANTTVKLVDRPGANPLAMNGRNFCNTVFDDQGGGGSIEAITPAGQPYTGTYTPAEALSAFNGQAPNGTWTLRALDWATPDTGNVRRFSLVITPETSSSVPDWSLY